MIVAFAVASHFVVKAIKFFSQRFLTQHVKSDVSSREKFWRKYPKVATITTIGVSAITFIIYFLAIGLILQELKIPLTTYLASATVIGLAIGFGLQGFVQDVVIGLTLIFTDTVNIGDMVELSGQVGTVETIGLRFTTLVNIHGQEIYIPNRNIGMIGRFRRGAIRAYADIQLPKDMEEEQLVRLVEQIAGGIYNQNKSIIFSQPELFGIMKSEQGEWKYLRVKFRLWPGQTAIIETAFKQRVLSAIKSLYADYADWMVTITYRIG
ncbi:mechanosensitive ion channel [candidate division KSB1 bacterium]|nr:mechanosensitive ion channel [candidate division KSB1 bacterium]